MQTKDSVCMHHSTIAYIVHVTYPMVDESSLDVAQLKIHNTVQGYQL